MKPLNTNNFDHRTTLIRPYEAFKVLSKRFPMSRENPLFKLLNEPMSETLKRLFKKREITETLENTREKRKRRNNLVNEITYELMTLSFIIEEETPDRKPDSLNSLFRGQTRILSQCNKVKSLFKSD